MLRDHAPDPSLLRQRQPAVAIDVHLYLLDQRPNPGIAADLRDGGVKHFIRAMEGVAISRGVGLTLALQDRMQDQNLAGGRALRGQLGGGRLEGLANDDSLRQCCDRDARDEDARLRKYLQQTFIGPFLGGPPPPPRAPPPPQEATLCG